MATAIPFRQILIDVGYILGRQGGPGHKPGPGPGPKPGTGLSPGPKPGLSPGPKALLGFGDTKNVVCCFLPPRRGEPPENQRKPRVFLCFRCPRPAQPSQPNPASPASQQWLASPGRPADCQARQANRLASQPASQPAGQPASHQPAGQQPSH